MKRNLFIATAALLFAACQHTPEAQHTPLHPGAGHLQLGRAIAVSDRDTTSRERGNPTESDLQCKGWGQCDSARS